MKYLISVLIIVGGVAALNGMQLVATALHGVAVYLVLNKE